MTQSNAKPKPETEQIACSQLWFDNHPDRSFVEKLRPALAYYAKQFNGARPNTVFVPANERWWTPGEVEGMEVRPAPGLLKNAMMLALVIAPDASETPIEETPS